MAEYVDERIAERAHLSIEDWPNDALSRFLSTAVDGETLSHRAIAIQVMFAIGAGSETTRNTLGSLLFALRRHPSSTRRFGWTGPWWNRPSKKPCGSMPLPSSWFDDAWYPNESWEKSNSTRETASC